MCFYTGLAHNGLWAQDSVSPLGSSNALPGVILILDRQKEHTSQCVYFSFSFEQQQQ